MVGPLITPRLIVREIVQSDWRSLHACGAHPDVSRLQTWGPNSPGESLQYIADALREQNRIPRMRYEFAILLKECRTCIGVCGLRLTRNVVVEADLGYTIHPDHWNYGYGTEAAERLLQYSFDDLRIFRVTAHCNAENTISIQVLEKIGMVAGKMENDQIRFAKLNHHQR